MKPIAAKDCWDGLLLMQSFAIAWVRALPRCSTACVLGGLREWAGLGGALEVSRRRFRSANSACSAVDRLSGSRSGLVRGRGRVFCAGHIRDAGCVPEGALREIGGGRSVPEEAARRIGDRGWVPDVWGHRIGDGRAVPDVCPRRMGDEGLVPDVSSFRFGDRGRVPGAARREQVFFRRGGMFPRRCRAVAGLIRGGRALSAWVLGRVRAAAR